MSITIAREDEDGTLWDEESNEIFRCPCCEFVGYSEDMEDPNDTGDYICTDCYEEEE